MYSIEIKSPEQQKFFTYLADNYHTQPANGIKTFLVKHKKKCQHKCMIYPSYGKYDWLHDGEKIYIEYYQDSQPLSVGDGIDVYCKLFVYHEDLDKLKGFIVNVFNYIDDIEDNDKDKVKLYISRCNQYCAVWDMYNTIKVQSFDNVYIDKKIKESVVQCIDKFISSEEKYMLFGRTHKLNLLFTGIPGSGKTSLCKALANKYGYPIYVINFNKSMTDEHLINLTSDVKEKSIILYEDIDVFFEERVSKDVNVSFSSLINILDGTLTKSSGNINIITTNYPDKIDSALLRPGRIDKIVRFDYPKKDEIRDAFKFLVENNDQKFESFYTKIKNIRFSMSAIIDYLFMHPDDYIDQSNIDELVSQHQFIQTVTKEDTSSKLYA
jgi:adenylate kinase family enzyme